jgi:hypothetical protein
MRNPTLFFHPSGEQCSRARPSFKLNRPGQGDPHGAQRADQPAGWNVVRLDGRADRRRRVQGRVHRHWLRHDEPVTVIRRRDPFDVVAEFR